MRRQYLLGVQAGTCGNTGRPPGILTLPARERWNASNPKSRNNPKTPVPPVTAAVPVVIAIASHASEKDNPAEFQNFALGYRG
jgi:hypothetical protein